MSILRKLFDPSYSSRAPTAPASTSLGESAFVAFGDNAFEQSEAPNLFSKSGPVFVNVNTIATRFAEATFKAFSTGIDLSQRTFQADQIVGRELPSHPILTLMSYGNEEMSGYDCRFTMAAIYLTQGECRILIERDANGLPQEMWPIPATFVSKSRTSKDKFHVEIPNFGKWDNVKKKDLLRFRLPDPVNPYVQSVSATEAVLHEAHAALFASKLAQEQFSKHGIPGLLVGVPGADDVALRRMEAKMRSKFHTRRNPGEALFVNHDIKVSPVDQKLTDLQAGQMRDLMDKMVGRTYGTSPEARGDTSNSNRATITVAETQTARNTVRPMLESFCGLLDSKLIPTLPERWIATRVGYLSPIPEDREFVLQVMNSNPGAFSINEVRKLVGYEPRPGHDELKVDSFLPPDMSTQDEDEGEDEPEDEESNNPFEDEESDSEDDEERQWWPQRALLATRITKEQTNALVQQGLSNPKLSKRFMERFGGRAENFLDRVATDLSLGKLVGNKRNMVLREVANRVAQDVDVWAEFTRDRVRKVIFESLDKGQAIEDTIEALQKVSRNFTESRAKTIAVTEIQKASQLAAQRLYEANDIATLVWITMRDARVRPSHRTMEGQVRPIGEEFESGAGNRTLRPGGFGIASEDVRCRCVIVPDSERAATYDMRSELWRGVQGIADEWSERSYGDLQVDMSTAMADLIDKLKAERGARVFVLGA